MKLTSEVAFQNARSGERVLIVAGRATASLVDPVREAKHWVESVTPLLPRVQETIVVVGIGSGFHLRELNLALEAAGLSNTTIYALDTCGASAEHARRELADIQSIKIVDLSDCRGIDDFFAQRDVVNWIIEPFTILRHRATIARADSTRLSLVDVETWILGRTTTALRAHLASRPRVAAALNSGKTEKVAKAKLTSGALYSIRDLTSMWDVASEPSTERRILRVLEELVR